MQPHEQHDPTPKKPDPRGTRAKWLLLAIAMLLGLVAAQVVKRFT
jgi:hypothetical protein